MRIEPDEADVTVLLPDYLGDSRQRADGDRVITSDHHGKLAFDEGPRNSFGRGAANGGDLIEVTCAVVHDRLGFGYDDR